MKMDSCIEKCLNLSHKNTLTELVSQENLDPNTFKRNSKPIRLESKYDFYSQSSSGNPVITTEETL